MDRLPLELLNVIVYFIEAESSLPTRRSALASLSRTNKTFHNIATPKLYLHVVLTSERRVEQWGNFYASKLNPWNLKDARDELRNLVVPTSITFTPSDNDSDPNLSTNTTTVFPQNLPPADPLLAVSTPLTSFFFRNLTSFVVSPGFTLDPKFVAALFAPTQSRRLALKHLDLSGKDLGVVVEFILGAFNLFDFELEVEEFDWESYETQDAEKVAYWERYYNPNEEAGEEPECLWDRISFDEEQYRLVSKAQLDWDCFSRLHSYEWGAHDPDYLHNHRPKLYPFSKLESFTLTDPTGQHLYILFTEPAHLCSLTSLKLVGSFEGEDVNGEDEIEHRLLGWRFAITKLDGSIVPPSDLPSLSRFFDDNGQLQDIGPVSPRCNIDKYTGLNLRLMDLSDLRIV